jgi:peptidoglycan hydrolase-like protein with peptidoglycan-binding domain
MDETTWSCRRRDSCAICYRQVLAVVILGGVGVFLFGGQSPKPNGSATAAAVYRTTPETTFHQTANFVDVREPKPQPPAAAAPMPTDTTRVQSRLIELGYLQGPADGLWGPKSRQALLAFKISNGLSSDDKFDASVNERMLFSNLTLGPLANTMPAPLGASGHPR